MKNSMFRNEHGRSFLNDAIRGAVDQCTSVYTGQRQVFLTKNLLLLTGRQCFQAETSFSVEKLVVQECVRTHILERWRPWR